jgi:hypothetical protein
MLKELNEWVLKTLTINFKCGFDVQAMIIDMLVYSTKLICVPNFM